MKPLIKKKKEETGVGFYEQGDSITWSKGQQFDDGSNILMVERMEERAIDVSVCQARYLMCCSAFLPCVWCFVCPRLCYARANTEEEMRNSALLVTDEAVVFYENEWTPQGMSCFLGTLPSKKFTVTYDQLQDIRMGPQGLCGTCCSCFNPGPGIQFYPVGHQDFVVRDGKRRFNRPPTWQPYSLDEEMLRSKKNEIEGYWNEYKKNKRNQKTGEGGGGVVAPGGMVMTGGEGVRNFCGGCGEKNNAMKKFCGDWASLVDESLSCKENTPLLG